MDAVKFIRERNRMCRTFDRSCDGCPAYENGWDCDNDAWNEKLVAIVEAWSAAHPRKTRQSIFLEQYPEAYVSDSGVLDICPVGVSAKHRTEQGGCVNFYDSCVDCRREFWLQEVE